MIQITLSQAAQIALCTSCPLADCQEGADCCPLVIEQRRLWKLRPKRSQPEVRTPEKNRYYNRNKTRQYWRERWRKMTPEQRERRREIDRQAWIKKKARIAQPS